MAFLAKAWRIARKCVANVLSSLPNLALYPVGALLRKSRDRGINSAIAEFMSCVAVAPCVARPLARFR